MHIRYPKLVLFFTNVFIITFLFGAIEGVSWLYLKSLWGDKIEEQISPEYLSFSSDQIKRLYETDDIEPIKKLLKRSGEPFEEEFIYHNFSNQDYRMRRVKNQAAWPPEKNKTNIFFFGGSTTLGYGVLLDQTIPSYTQELFDLKENSNISVYNFGENSYTSKNELFLFKNILHSGFVPEIAIFIHGLNDFAYQTDKKSSSFGKNVLLAFENLFKKTNLNKVLNIFFGVRSSGASIKKTLALLNTRRKIIKKEFCEKFGTICLFVHQPIPVYHFDIKKHLFINYKFRGKAKLALGFINNGSYGYELFNNQIKNNELSDFKNQLLDLSKFEINSNQYIDTIHYSPKFNRAIAREIVKFIEEKKS
jgi:hypothetical protein